MFAPPQQFQHLNALKQRPGGFAGPTRLPSAGKPSMPAPRPGPGMPGPMGGPGMPGPMGGFMPPPSGNRPLGGFSPMGGGFDPSQLDGPMQHLFTALPAGTEEAFGAAPQGFNMTHRGGQKRPPMPMLGGGMF